MSETTVSVIFTRHYDFASKLLCCICGRGYTHAALSLNEQEDCFYSFTYRGFGREHPIRRIKAGNCQENACIHLKVSQKEYMQMKESLADFRKDADSYRYTRLGVVLCLLGIPYKFAKRYFCSQFVAEILSVIETIPLSKDPSLYLPNDLYHALLQADYEYEETVKLECKGFEPVKQVL